MPTGVFSVFLQFSCLLLFLALAVVVVVVVMRACVKSLFLQDCFLKAGIKLIRLGLRRARRQRANRCHLCVVL